MHLKVGFHYVKYFALFNINKKNVIITHFNHLKDFSVKYFDKTLCYDYL